MGDGLVVTIKIALSQAGQRASLLASGDGKAVQSILVERDSPDYERTLSQASVSSDGVAELDARHSDTWDNGYDPIYWDHVPTVGEVLADLDARRQAWVEKPERQRQERRAEIGEVLCTRKTTERPEHTDRIAYLRIVPAYPWGYPKYDDEAWFAELERSHEATAWLAELAAENERRIAAATEEAQREREATERKAAERKAALDARRAKLGLADGEFAFEVRHGALTTVPVWDGEGRNWCATIAHDPAANGGLACAFWRKAKGEYYYLLPESLPCGTAVEFGADYRAERNRWYGYVVRIRPADDEFPAQLILHRCAASGEAIDGGSLQSEPCSVTN
jgi:hypothetical protein